MKIVWRTDSGDDELDIRVPAGAVVGDLVAALAGPSGRVAAWIDGVEVPADVSIEATRLADGSVVALAGPDRQRDGLRAELRAVGGPMSGGRWLLRPGTYRVGSDSTCEIPIADPTVNAVHCTVAVAPSGRVLAEPCGRSDVVVDGSLIQGARRLSSGTLIQLGEVFLEYLPADDRPPDRSPQPPSGAFNRPPRHQRSEEPSPVFVPHRPAEPTAQARFGWATLLVPLVMGALFAVLFTPMMATFALLGPMMMMATWFEDRRRVKKGQAEAHLEFAGALARFDADLVRASAARVRWLRTTLPDPAQVIGRALTGDPRLWERRPGHHDFMRMSLGAGTIVWDPPLAGRIEDPEIRATVDRRSTIDHAPVALDLQPGVILGLAGSRDRTLPLARWLVTQVAVHQGPADVRVAVVTDREDDWDWTKWLPHTGADASLGCRLLAGTPDEIDSLLERLGTAPEKGGPPEAILVVVADHQSLDPGRQSRLRIVHAGSGRRVAGIVLASSTVQLPGWCNVVVELGDGGGACRFPLEGRSVDDLVPIGLPAGLARECARSLARLIDPEIDAESSELPDMVPLIGLLGDDARAAEDIVRRWESAGVVPTIAGPIGSTERGPLTVDLVHDGPHGLIAGTTGSGKSELLRSLIVSLAASVGPDHLTFALIDYKGGSAFDACARLPHVVGVVTDLDAHLGRRALSCLEAELRYRETRLREAEASDLPEFLATLPEEPLPRLVVVIDEFAAMAAELPGFVSSLVDIAQRGRSLGVHLLLATQRPAGVVGENIRANTNLRIALRVHDTSDSRDVLDDAAAAAIPRGSAGRGYLRLGPGELLPFQAALISTPGLAKGTAPVEVRPFEFGWEAPGSPRSDDRAGGIPTDLDLLVDMITEAAHLAGTEPPRSLWPPELPEHVDLESVLDWEDGDNPHWAPLGLLDEPHRQRRSVCGWEGSNMLLYGMPGSGPAQALLALGSSLATRYSPDRVHIYALDFGPRVLEPLELLPHVGAVVDATDRERQVRLLRYLHEEVERRRSIGPGDHPALVLLLDNYAGFAAAFDQPADLGYRDRLQRIVADGPGVGVYTAISADHASAVPTNMAALIPEKLAFRMADLFDYATLGLPNCDIPDLPDGRAIRIGDGLLVQIGTVSSTHVGRILARTRVPDGAPVGIGVLPVQSNLTDVIAHASITDRDWFLPVGIGDRRLQPVGLRLGEDGSALVAGPARSGKSTALLAISQVVADHRADVAITAVAPRKSPLWESRSIDSLVTDPLGLEDLIQRILGSSDSHLVLVDDADDVDDAQGALLGLIRARRSNVRVVGAGRADVLRSLYGHWTQELRRSRQGIALRPQVDVDGELWHTTLPRHGPPLRTPGRGYLISEEGVELVQVSQP